MYGELLVLHMYNIQEVRFVSNYIMYHYLLMVFIVRGLRAVSLISKRGHVSSIPLLLSIFLVCRWKSFFLLFPAISIYIYFCILMMMNEVTIILLRWLLL